MRLRLQKTCTNLRIPLVKFLLQSHRDVALCLCEIVSLTRVGRQVIQVNLAVLESFDQLVPTTPNRGARKATLVTVMRVMPDYRAVFGCGFAIQHR